MKIKEAKGVQKCIKDVSIGDRVMGTNGSWRRVTDIKPFGRGQKLVSIDNNIDGAYGDDFKVLVEE